jgi:hypothetical protein
VWYRVFESHPLMRSRILYRRFSVAGFFEGFFDVLVEGAIFGKGDAEVVDVLKFGDGLVVE